MKAKFVSHSQHGDDYLAWQLLGCRKDGLVVEVGAFDGIHLSNSFALEGLGWRSICIEPNPNIFDFLQANRPNAACFSCAVVDSDSIREVEFLVEEIGVLSGIALDLEDVKRRYKSRGIEFKGPQTVKVRARTMNDILSDERIRANEIDLISIDVEGYELNVLKGFDIDHYKPSLLIVEANNEQHRDEILDYFGSYPQYMYLGSNRQNMFIIEKDKVDRKFLRRIDFKKYIAAEQHHPISERLAIQSVPPSLNRSPEFRLLAASWLERVFRL